MIDRRLLLTAAALSPTTALAQAPKKRPVTPARPRKPAETAANGPPATPAQTPLGPVDTSAKWAVIIDYNTGATLLNKDADVPMVPSSMTKLMTAYIVYGMLKSGRLKLDQELPVSEKAWRMQGSKMFVGLGTKVKVEDLIRGMIVQSGNDACIVLAEAIAGSEDQFVDLMNEKAKVLGLQQSHFRNATGWPDPGHRMSVRDIAVVAQHLIREFPEYYKYDSEKSFKYNNIDQLNRNTLVQKNLADGLKTGHTEEGGYGLVASADRGGRRVIVVLNGMASMHQRGAEGEKLLEWAFREWENVTLFTAAETVEKMPVWLGTAQTVPLVTGRDVVLTLPRAWRNTLKVDLAYESPIRAPVLRGTALGTLSVRGAGVPDADIKLLAGADVPKLGLPGRAMAVLARYMGRS